MYAGIYSPIPLGVCSDLFVNKLFSGNCIPTFLWSNHRLFKHIQELFQDSDNSIVSVAKKLKAEFRRYFSVPGAFISLLNCEQFTIPNESRIKWLFGDESCRNIILSHSIGKKDHNADGHIFELFWKIQHSYLCHQMIQQINIIFNLPPLGVDLVPVSEFHMSSRIYKLILLLGNVRQKVTTWKDSGANQSENSDILCKKLNEYIILASQFASEEESNSAPMARSLVENILRWAGEEISVQITLEDSASVQPRRDVARALCLPLPNTLEHYSLSHASRIAFQVLESKVTTLSSWHERYFDVVTEYEGLAVGTNEAEFFFAIQELVHMGFVKKLMTGRRKEHAYEKLALMWSSGR